MSGVFVVPHKPYTDRMNKFCSINPKVKKRKVYICSCGFIMKHNRKKKCDHYGN